MSTHSCPWKAPMCFNAQFKHVHSPRQLPKSNASLPAITETQVGSLSISPQPWPALQWGRLPSEKQLEGTERIFFMVLSVSSAPPPPHPEHTLVGA